MVTGGAIGAVAAIITDGGAVVIAAGIKTDARKGRLSWRPFKIQRLNNMAPGADPSGFGNETPYSPGIPGACEKH
jgi:hypothetical protein